MRRSIHLTVGVLAVLVARHAVAEVPVTRTYDVKRLLFSIPDFTNAIDYKHGGAIWASPNPPAEEIDPEKANAGKLVIAGEDAKRAAADRDAARSKLLSAVRFVLAGTPGSSADEKDGSLIVNATASDQKRVERVIAAAAEPFQKQVTISAMILSCNAATCAKLDPSVRDLIDASLLHGHLPTSLTNEQRDAIIRAVAQSTDGTILTAPRMTLFQDQRAWSMSGTQRAFISAVKAVTGKDGAISYDPELSIVESGDVFDSKASVSADNSAISLVMRAQISQLVDLKPAAVCKPGGGPPQVQVPVVRVLEATPTVTMKPGQWCLFPVDVVEGPAAEAGTVNLLIVKTDLILPTEEPTTPSPASAK